MKAATSLAGLAVALMGTFAQAQPQVPKPSIIELETPGQCARGEQHRRRHSGHGRTDGSAICDMNAEFLSWIYRWRVAISDVTHSSRLNLTNCAQFYEHSAKADFRYIHL
ncbi:hypothetical protein DL766_004612 [Monosporascus sp. MC13-8B]|uniref:Uncharacterized protein n=1 Tax=Monosporascus cannonballus TaxID=155416 RepID=A0ABY0HEC7_9PEZI|nr:hypothetical protein DL763_006228 [Monosporascus cannonballus]RYO89545.1 hypothetical protein DL762_003158 [Monosporascus cannonballus]RYP30998.1 hypothetical protein DL766_004612 [Monosporascus sp. MC13-8B]